MINWCEFCVSRVRGRLRFGLRHVHRDSCAPLSGCGMSPALNTSGSDLSSLPEHQCGKGLEMYQQLTAIQPKSPAEREVNKEQISDKEPE